MKIILLLAGTGLLLLLGAVLGHQSPAVELQNLSDRPVESFRLSVGGHPAASGSLAQGSLDRHLVPVRDEGPVRLDLRFAGGQDASFDAGWFSPAQSGVTRIAILSPDSVVVGPR